MRWRDLRRSSNVEDRRGQGGFGGLGGGMGSWRGGSMGGRRGGMAIGGGLGGLVVLVLAYVLGISPGSVEQVPNEAPTYPAESGGPISAADDTLKQFVSAVLGHTEDVWGTLFQQDGRQYAPPRLVLFSGQVQSACGMAGAAVGPFYCPTDRRVYIDLTFYRQLRDRLGAPGDFAQAYVIAHEVGHHIQNLLGVSDQVHRAQQRTSRAEANELSVRLELQADYLAGVWAHHAEQAGILEVGDVDEALNAASAIGDDKLQREAQGRVVPDSFTHGTSEQRMRWFRKGLESGRLDGGDTFAAETL